MAKPKLVNSSFDRQAVDSSQVEEDIAIAKQSVQDSINVKEQLLALSLGTIINASKLVSDCLLEGGKIIIFGNGGSAADAQHFAAELVGRFNRDRQPLRAMALTTNSSSITAIGNDFGFEEIYARQVQAFADKGDVVIAISASGRSKNILKAVETARACGAITIGLTGANGGVLKDICDCTVQVPSEDVQRIQESHALINHIICQLVERNVPLKG